MKDKFLALVDVLEGLGKEVLAFCCLVSGLFLLIKGYLNGEQFTELVKTVSIAYISGATIGGTSDAILKHFKERAMDAIQAIKNKGQNAS